MDAVLLQLQIQICVGEATGTPVLLVHNLTRLRFELAADLAAPRAIFEGLSQLRCFLDGCNVFPGLVVAWTVAMMQRIEHAKFSLPRGTQDLQRMRNTMICLRNSLQAIS
jgi:hypothetical protein